MVANSSNSGSSGSGSGSPMSPAKATIQHLSNNNHDNWTTSQPSSSQPQITRYGNPTNPEGGQSKGSQDDQLSQDLLLALQLQDEVNPLRVASYITPSPSHRPSPSP